MTQPKYKFGDKVKSIKHSTNFKVECIKYDKISGCFFYNFCNSPFESIPESQLEIVVEPLCEEFEDNVYECLKDARYGVVVEKKLHKFIGKKVHVKVTEVL